MNLTRHTDYALRVMLYLAADSGKPVPVSRVADYYQISRHHLVKVVQRLHERGFVTTTRGQHGGVCLAQASDQVSVGEVVRCMENHFHLVECFDPTGRGCAIAGVCGLQGLLAKATEEFMQRLDAVTLASLITPNLQRRIFAAGSGAPIVLQAARVTGGAE